MYLAWEENYMFYVKYFFQSSAIFSYIQKVITR